MEYLVEDSVVTAMVDYTIDEAISSEDRIPKHVKKLLQEKLDKIESGITVVSMQLTDITWPRQVNAAFQAAIIASQASQQFITEAKTYAETTLNRVAGAKAQKLLDAIKNETIEQVGVLDERFFLYWEDADWCFRIKQKGWKVFCMPSAPIIHYEGGSSKNNELRLIIYFHKSVYMFYRKHDIKSSYSILNFLALAGLTARALLLYTNALLALSFGKLKRLN